MIMLLFYVGKNAYAIDCQSIVEVFPRVNLKSVPHTPPYVAGILNSKGNPIIVIDLCKLIEDRDCASCLHTRIILLSNSSGVDSTIYLGVIAEKVIEIIDRKPEEFLVSGFKVKELPFLTGVITEPQRTVQQIDVNELFNSMKNILF